MPSSKINSDFSLLIKIPSPDNAETIPIEVKFNILARVGAFINLISLIVTLAFSG